MHKNSELWLDNNGERINAHGGGILYHGGRYYWYGEHKRSGPKGQLAFDGVHCYASEDLRGWRDAGLALKVLDDPAGPIGKGCRIERPKVIFCAATGKFVMWFHSTDAGHTLAKSGVAVADSPAGPFSFVRAFRPDAGRWPLNVTAADQDPATIAAAAEAEAAVGGFENGENEPVKEHNVLGLDFEGGQQSRDQTLFVDDDGYAYHIHASERNGTLHIAQLADDYLDHAAYVRVLPGRWHEAPAIFKRDGKYYLLSSGCTRWAPNPARASVADHIFGPWTELGNPCRGVNPTNQHGPETTYGCQSTFVLKVEGQDRYIAMFDEWRPGRFDDSRYVWLPVRFTEGGFQIAWQDDAPTVVRGCQTL